MTELWVTVVWVLGPPLVGVAGLAVRLRWQTRRDRQRQRTIRALAGSLRGSSAVEIEGDGLKIRITP
jgi:hypothetical protein